MLFLLVFYLALLVYYRKTTVVAFLALLQVLSVGAGIVAGYEIKIESFKGFLWILFLMVGNFIVISSWKPKNGITAIVGNDKRIKSFANMLFGIMPFIWIVLLITSLTVIILVGDAINEFKYVEDNSMEFFYTMLPIDVRLYMLATLLYQFSYFLFPLHFYFLYNKEYKKALWCLLFSTNILLYGATFFSRWTLVLYFFIYISMFLLLKEAIDAQIVKRIKKNVLIAICIGGGAFLSISLGRFDDNRSYEAAIPSESLVHSPTLYSFFDYLGQSSALGFEVLNEYDGETMRGALITQSLRPLLSTTGLVSFDEDIIKDKRKMLLGDSWYKFIGLIPYFVFDFGIIISFLLLLLYRRKIIQLLTPTVTFHKLCLITIFIQLPLCSIFYSVGASVLYLLVCYTPIYLYLFIKRY